MKKSNKQLIRVIISILYIVWGVAAPVSMLEAIVALDLTGILSAAVGILMLLSGVFALLGIKKSKCRIFAAIILVLSLLTLFSSITFQSIASAVLSVLFFICL